MQRIKWQLAIWWPLWTLSAFKYASFNFVSALQTFEVHYPQLLTFLFFFSVMESWHFQRKLEAKKWGHGNHQTNKTHFPSLLVGSGDFLGDRVLGTGAGLRGRVLFFSGTLLRFTHVIANNCCSFTLTTL